MRVLLGLALAVGMMLPLAACQTKNTSSKAAAMTQTDKQYPELASVYARMKAGEHVTVAYLGGSITWGAQATDPMKTSYRALVTKHLEEKFPEAHVRAVDAAIGGTPSKLGVFRMDRDVLPQKPDLTFVEFSVNDGDSPDSQETVEGIFRKLKKSNPAMAIVYVITGAGRNNYGAPNREKHIELCNYYGIPYTDVCGQVRAMLDQKKLTIADVLNDGAHPHDGGYRIYTDIICRDMDTAAAKKGKAVAYPGKPLTANHYERAALLELAKLPKLGDWKSGVPSLVGTWFDHQPSRWLSSVVIAQKAGAKLPVGTLKTDGVGLYYEIFKDAGSVEVRQGSKVLLTAKTDMNMPEHRVAWTFQLLDKVEERPMDVVCREDKLVRVAYVMYLKD